MFELTSHEIGEECSAYHLQNVKHIRITRVNGSMMFVPPFAIKVVLTHLEAFKIASSVAASIDGDNK